MLTSPFFIARTHLSTRQGFILVLFIRSFILFIYKRLIKLLSGLSMWFFANCTLVTVFLFFGEEYMAWLCPCTPASHIFQHFPDCELVNTNGGIPLKSKTCTIYIMTTHIKKDKTQVTKYRQTVQGTNFSLLKRCMSDSTLKTVSF